MSNSIIDAHQTFKEFEFNLVVDKYLGILTLNGSICSVMYQDDKGYAVFECNNKGYILKNKTLYLMKDIAYINLLLKIDDIQRKCSIEKPSIIKNVKM